MEYILRTNTVSKKYTNYYAVDKVSISIKKGEIYGLIGENGAGKSTLMKMIAGLVEPSEGSVELFGNFVPQTERYRIGCVIESPALYAELTAKQNLEVFRKAYGPCMGTGAVRDQYGKRYDRSCGIYSAVLRTNHTKRDDFRKAGSLCRGCPFPGMLKHKNPVCTYFPWYDSVHDR